MIRRARKAAGIAKVPAAPFLRELTRHVDDRGDLVEIYRISWELFPVPVKQVYMVTDPAPLTIRAFHRHQELWDGFYIANGSAVFHLYKQAARGGYLTAAGPAETHAQFVLSVRKPQVLVVPPLWWHGWQSLEPNTVLICLASHEYNAALPDEERVKYDFRNTLWGIQPK